MSDQQMLPLAQELKTFEEKVLPLKDKQGKYAVLRGSNILGFFNDYEDALSAAYKEYGLEPFLVKQVTLSPAVTHYTRSLSFV
ncbi:hypothetical protein [Neokomagataea anthophila]|uniref:DUF5678 domain-containing protein n=1 Tax=Neokomagataea anthophila TaxID=2826925 RepID=A0ABS5E821_9PROT|nr:hypothetical protein [Neokomagataea anthophila]MBR0560042.1 hypothetical protein [Neokomagataea anthophila]